MKLAGEYLARQRELWPELVEAGLLPDPENATLTNMAVEFKHRHRTGSAIVDSVSGFTGNGRKLGGSYNRYSCDNSDTNSIIDQMVNSLAKAKQENRFVPWSYVFADYSVSGLDASRQGYSSYKSVLADEGHRIETTYVDDFTRASRDELEWWKLAALSKRLGKRLIGASDSFDLTSPHGDILITMYGLVSRLFIKGLREKVKRGMGGARRRGTCVGMLPLGFTRRPRMNADGSIERGPDGKPVYEPCHDPDTAEHARLVFDLFIKCTSRYKIATRLNKLKVDGWDGWTEGAIKKIVENPAYIGVFIWNRTRREFDWEQEKWVIVKNPRSEWEVFYDPELALIPMEWWRATQRRCSELRRKSPLTGRKRSRNQRFATTLFSGTLFCESCGHELTLNRSAGKYKSMHCINGGTGAHGCQLTSSKSTNIIENCLLGFLRDSLLTTEVLEQLLQRANEYLAIEAARPRRDTRPLKAELRKEEAAVKKLLQRVVGQTDESLCKVYEAEIGKRQRKIDALKAELRDAESQNAPPPAPLTPTHIPRYLEDLQSLLNQEIPAAAEAIRNLTGMIKIHDEAIPERKQGARWIATFSPNLLRILAQLGRDRDYPDSITLELLCTRNWIIPAEVTVVLEKTFKYEVLAPKFLELHEKGVSTQSIAAAHGLTWDYVNQTLEFAKTGKQPEWGAQHTEKRGACRAKYGDGVREETSTQSGHRNATKYVALAPEVSRLREEKKLTYSEIAKALGVSKSTVTRAYDCAHTELIRRAVQSGITPNRGRCGGLGDSKHEEIRRRLQRGERVAEIAEAVGCSDGTVYRQRRRLEAEAAAASGKA